MPARDDRYDRILLRLPPELGQAVRHRAELDGRPISWTLRDLVRVGLDESSPRTGG